MISPLSARGQFTRTGICTIVDMESLAIEIDGQRKLHQSRSTLQPVERLFDAYPESKFPCK